jgi:hypothetical protein
MYRKISAINESILPIFSNQLEKHEPAALLLNEFIKNKWNVRAVIANLNVENDDSWWVCFLIRLLITTMCLKIIPLWNLRVLFK